LTLMLIAGTCLACNLVAMAIGFRKPAGQPELSAAAVSP